AAAASASTTKALRGLDHAVDERAVVDTDVGADRRAVLAPPLAVAAVHERRVVAALSEAVDRRVADETVDGRAFVDQVRVGAVAARAAGVIRAGDERETEQDACEHARSFSKDGTTPDS